jgi:hypothetical protein
LLKAKIQKSDCIGSIFEVDVMIKRFFFSFLVSFVFTFSVFAAPTKILFCESLSDDLTPVNVKSEFTTNNLAFLLKVDEPFGDLNLLVSLYRVNENGHEVFDSRMEVPVNPRWNCLGYQKITLPEGKFRIEFSKKDGELLAIGEVTISGNNVSKAAPIEEVKVEQVKGKTVEDYFKKFEQKAKKVK